MADLDHLYSRVKKKQTKQASIKSKSQSQYMVADGL